MKTIWKFPLEITDYQTINMPRSCSHVAVQMQFGQLVLWSEVETTNPLEPRKFAVHGTGHEIPAGEKYIGTVQDRLSRPGVSFVWHVFEEVATA